MFQWPVSSMSWWPCLATLLLLNVNFGHNHLFFPYSSTRDHIIPSKCEGKHREYLSTVSSSYFSSRKLLLRARAFTWTAMSKLLPFLLHLSGFKTYDSRVDGLFTYFWLFIIFSQKLLSLTRADLRKTTSNQKMAASTFVSLVSINWRKIT